MAWRDSRWHYGNLPSDDLLALSRRLGESFLGRCVRRFLAMAGIDRCIVLSSQAFTAIIPLLILFPPSLRPGTRTDRRAGDRSPGSDSPATRPRRTSALRRPGQAPRAASVSSVRSCSFSGVSFTRGCRRCTAPHGSRSTRVRERAVRSPWTCRPAGGGARALRDRERGQAPPVRLVVGIPLSVATGLVLWTSIPYLLLNRAVHWRRLLVTGGSQPSEQRCLRGGHDSLHARAHGAGTPNEFGLFGITIVLIGWLLVVSGVIVGQRRGRAPSSTSPGRLVVRLKTRFHLMDPDGPVRGRRPWPCVGSRARRGPGAAVRVAHQLAGPDCGGGWPRP